MVAAVTMTGVARAYIHVHLVHMSIMSSLGFPDTGWQEGSTLCGALRELNAVWE
jgi:hypothetical protein